MNNNGPDEHELNETQVWEQSLVRQSGPMIKEGSKKGHGIEKEAHPNTLSRMTRPKAIRVCSPTPESQVGCCIPQLTYRRHEKKSGYLCFLKKNERKPGWFPFFSFPCEGVCWFVFSQTERNQVGLFKLGAKEKEKKHRWTTSGLGFIPGSLHCMGPNRCLLWSFPSNTYLFFSVKTLF